MKKFTLCILVALAAMTINAAELQIGNHDSTCKYAPVYGDQADRLFISQVIYTADELSAMAGTEITKLTFDLKSACSTAWTGLKISLKEVDFTAFPSTAFVSLDGATQVFSGTVTGAGTTTVEIELSQPFTYNGGNLLFDCRKTQSGGNYTYPWKGFYASSVFEYQVLSKYSSGSSMPEEGVRSYDRPDVTFTYSGADQAVELTEVNTGAVKRIENGQLIFEKNGVKFNALGATIK